MTPENSDHDEFESENPEEAEVVKESNYWIPGMIIFPISFFIFSVYITNNAGHVIPVETIIFLAFVISFSITAIAVYAMFRNSTQSEMKTSPSISGQLRPAQPRGYNPIIKTQEINGVTRQVAYYNPNIKVDNDADTAKNWSYIGIALGFCFIVGAMMNAGIDDDSCTGFCGLGVLLLSISGIGLATVADNKSIGDQLMILFAILLALFAGVILLTYMNY